MEWSGRQAVFFSLSLFVLWTLATYFLEGRLLTLQRPEATMLRLGYTTLANIIIGTLASLLLMRYFLSHTAGFDPAFFGVTGLSRTVIVVIIGLILGLAVFALQSPPSWNPVVLVNAYSQTLVVSIAEVLVCWSLLGGTIINFGREGRPFWLLALALVISAVLFGLYHFAHSPPFNTLRMVGLLTVVGLLTGIFFLAAKNFYGTIIFHNFLALKGVTQALAGAGHLDKYKTLQLPLLITALAALLVLIVLDLTLIRGLLSTQSRT